jgi:hypothetical protein
MVLNRKALKTYSRYAFFPAQDVAQWRGPNRNGIYNETGLLNKWPDAGPKMK